MDTVTFTYYDERNVPESGRKITRDRLARVGVYADEEHVIDLDREYCETCRAGDCEYVETALDHVSEAF